MDLHLIDSPPTVDEQAAVDALLGPETGPGPAAGRIVRGGVRAAAAQRHLLLPGLHALQDAVGWISREGLGYLCRRLAVPPAEAYGVASFYSLLATEERPPQVVHLCDDVPCLLAGVSATDAESVRATGTVQASPCLGQCDRAPAGYVQRAGSRGWVEAPMSESRLDALAGGVGPERPTRASVSLPSPPGEGPIMSALGATTLDDYRTAGGYEALARALEIGRDRVLAEVDASRLRGRGGAAFPATVKWRAVASAGPGARYVVCNADESEPGTFKDRVLLEGNPFAVVEAMTIAGITVGAEHGYVYVRDEYPVAETAVRDAITETAAAGLLGDDVAGSGHTFHIEVRRGGGAYVCGEETALFNSIEGYRGEPRQKPPFPTDAGLFGKPTLVNNVETLVNVPRIVLEGGSSFAAVGTAQSTGTKLFCVTGHVEAPGVYEVPFGTTLGELVTLAGGVTGTLRAVLLGGGAGSFVTPDRLGLPLTFEDTGATGLSLGSGAVIVMNDATDFGAVVRRISAFFRDESCGQCVPCRVGTARQEEAVVRITSNHSARAGDRRLLDDIEQAMRDASICGLGHTAGLAVRSALRIGLIGGGAS